MIDEAAQRDWFRTSVQRAGSALWQSSSERLTQMRQQACESLDALPVISRRQEAWRYTRIDSLLDETFSLDAADGYSSIAIDEYPLLPEVDTYRLVFVNGHFIAHLSSQNRLPDGVALGSLRDYLEQQPDQVMRWLGSVAGKRQHLFNALNTALIDDGLFLHVGKGVCLDRPIELLCLGATRTEANLVPMRNLIVLEAGAQAELVEHVTGETSARYFHNGVTEILLEDSAVLNHVRFQNEAHRAWHLGSLFVSLGTASQYRGVPLVLGGAWSRTEYYVDFSGENARCDLDGLYTVGGSQLADVHVNVEHLVPSCTSLMNFRGLLHGKGRAVFDGCIRVGESAQQTDAQLRNDNLILAPDAEIDTKPRLEIFADDVKCSHGTTVGQLDPQQLFYLRSRGLDKAAARTLLALGFASSIVQALDNMVLREQAEKLLRGMLTPAE